MKPTSLAFEQRYSDDSGVEFSVSLANNKINFRHIDDTDFPVDQIDWLIACLQKIKEELPL